MRQHSFLKFLASWTGGFRLSRAPGQPWPRPAAGPTFSSPSMPAVSFSPEQLDQLSGLVAPGRDDACCDRSPRWDDRDTASARRHERFLSTVDRAIAEIAEPRKRRKRARW
jgi:hypothetical protein